MSIKPVRYVTYNKIADIPDDLFIELTINVTMWRAGGGMRYTAEDYRRLGTPLPVAVAFKNNAPIGWVFYDTWHKVEMYVQPEHRRRGVASKLLYWLARHMNTSAERFTGYNGLADLTIRKAARWKKLRSTSLLRQPQ
jgi:GNAT superfamily N-acetyltransferase